MKAVCPNNNEHKKFATVVHVMQDWVVDEAGEFIEVLDDCLQVTHKPCKENIWTCSVCGAEAIVTE